MIGEAGEIQQERGGIRVQRGAMVEIGKHVVLAEVSSEASRDRDGQNVHCHPQHCHCTQAVAAGRPVACRTGAVFDIGICTPGREPMT